MDKETVVLFLIFGGLFAYIIYNENRIAKEEALAERLRRINEALTNGVKKEMKYNEDAFNQSRDDLNDFNGANRDVLRKHGIIGNTATSEGHVIEETNESQ